MPSFVRVGAAVVCATFFVTPALAQPSNRPGVSDTEIKIGNVAPYSGPGSAYSAIARAEAAYFKMLNDKGGINGRKINFISYDDGFSPPKAIEQTKKLVESDDVFLITSALGNQAFAVQKYMTRSQVPQLFIASGASKASQPDAAPWSMGWTPPYAVESVIYAKHILATAPNAKIAILYQNDDFGREFLDAFKMALGDRVSMIVKEAPYTPTDPTVDSQVVTLHASGADVFLSLTTPRAAAQALRKVHELNWRATIYQSSVSASIGSVLTPVGPDKVVGLLTVGVFKDYSDPTWTDDPGMKNYVSFMNQYLEGADKSDSSFMNGYAAAQALEYVLRESGNNLTRHEVMDKAINLKDVSLNVLLPGITLNTDPSSRFPFKKMRLMKFNGKIFEIITPPIDGSAGLDR